MSSFLTWQIIPWQKFWPTRRAKFPTSHITTKTIRDHKRGCSPKSSFTYWDVTVVLRNVLWRLCMGSYFTWICFILFLLDLFKCFWILLLFTFEQFLNSEFVFTYFELFIWKYANIRSYDFNDIATEKNIFKLLWSACIVLNAFHLYELLYRYE